MGSHKLGLVAGIFFTQAGACRCKVIHRLFGRVLFTFGLLTFSAFCDLFDGILDGFLFLFWRLWLSLCPCLYVLEAHLGVVDDTPQCAFVAVLTPLVLFTQLFYVAPLNEAVHVLADGLLACTHVPGDAGLVDVEGSGPVLCVTAALG